MIHMLILGMKYWSCCQRKTSEFQQFLDQEGCDIGTCTWTRADGKGWSIIKQVIDLFGIQLFNFIIILEK